MMAYLKPPPFGIYSSTYERALAADDPLAELHRIAAEHQQPLRRGPARDDPFGDAATFTTFIFEVRRELKRKHREFTQDNAVKLVNHELASYPTMKVLGMVMFPYERIWQSQLSKWAYRYVPGGWKTLDNS